MSAEAASRTPQHRPPPRASVLASAVTVVLAAAAALVGAFVPGFYQDAPTLVSQARAQDLLTAFVAVPALAASLRYARRGSLRGYVLWLGVTGYVLYTYASYAFMTAFNPLYLVYTTLLALSLVAFVGGMVRLDAAAVKDALDGRPLRSVVAFEVLVVVLVAGVWLAEIVPALLEGTVPASVETANLPVSVIHSLDLGVVLPAFLVAAYWLARSEPWGYALSVVLLTKVATLGAAVLAMAVLQALDGQSLVVGQVVVFAALTLASVGFLASVLGRMTPDAPADGDGTPPESGPGVDAD